MAAGSIPTTMNTDNAWAEIRQVVVDCTKVGAFCLGLETLERKGEVRWVDYTKLRKIVKGEETNEVEVEEEADEMPDPQRFSITCPKKRGFNLWTPFKILLHILFLPLTLLYLIIIMPCMMLIFYVKMKRMGF